MGVLMSRPLDPSMPRSEPRSWQTLTAEHIRPDESNNFIYDMVLECSDGEYNCKTCANA
jgi:hypothetical protein